MTEPVSHVDPQTTGARKPITHAWTLMLCALAVGADLAIVLGVSEGRLAGADVLPLLFLVGPPVFLALVAWRRRAHPGRARTLLQLAVGIGVVGPAALGALVYRSRAADRAGPEFGPLLVPLAEWVVLLVVWVAIARAEGREKRAAQPPPAG